MRTAILVIYLPSILMTLGQGMIIPALPALGETFDVSGAVAVQTITAQLLGRALSLVPAGAVVDRWGTRAPMIAGAALSTVSAFGAALSPSFVFLVITQFTWGVGMSTWMFGREVAAFDMVRRDQRGRQMAALMGIGSAGMALGPAVGGVLTDVIGVRGLFWVYTATAAVVLFISTVHRENSRRSQPVPKRQGALFSFKRVMDIHPYFRMTYMILFFATFAQMVRSQVTNSMLPLYTQEELAYSPTETGLLFTVVGFVTLGMIVPTGFISDKLGRKWAAGGAAFFSTVAFLVVPLTQSIPGLAAAMVLMGLANGLAMGAMTIYTYDIVPEHAKGQLQAMRRSFGEFGALTAPPMAGVVALFFSPSAAFWFFAPMHALSLVLIVVVARESLHRRLAPDAPRPE